MAFQLLLCKNEPSRFSGELASRNKTSVARYRAVLGAKLPASPEGSVRGAALTGRATVEARGWTGSARGPDPCLQRGQKP
ncbi:hypothetical protein SKAU_G00387680 [Synaphobranchus kaupii]|uniref:Uncharacterized protein n=1 Tax=Synaphobranchus kaupii TaxID=118154 RepID=A0A9Q1EAY0_SYNKA|nr:hypothetical protein SKAU_G00387680 [Synaphobranchus kaupii]